MAEYRRQVELTLATSRPAVVTRPGGGHQVEMDGFGVDSDPGAPRLPILLCQVELPASAADVRVDVIDEMTPMSGHFRITPAAPVVHDEPGGEATRALAVGVAERAAARTQREIYGADRWYPASPARLEAVASAPSRVIADLRVTPVRYHPTRGELGWTPSVRVTVHYSLPEEAAEAFGDVAVTTVAQPRINPFAASVPAAAAAARRPEPDDGAADYVIIVADAAIEQAVQRLVAWKESIGHRVVVEQLTNIVSSVGGVDDAERVREHLIDRHRAWGVHYVLLVGSMGVIPTRLLYADDRTDAYASDSYFADLVTANWDLDGDDRWGEFGDDRCRRGHDVAVGRLPLDTAAEVQQYCDDVIAFERDLGGWKRHALFAAGFMDFLPTDGAELCERLVDNVLKPAGWTARTMYEQHGTLPSVHASDRDLDQANYADECRTRPYAVVTLVAHGNPDEMDGRQRTATGSIDNSFGEDSDIAVACPPGVVNMMGCSTACPVPDYQHVETQPGGAVVSPGRSLFPFAALQDHNGARYLRNGAVAAIGASAGIDYAHRWHAPGDGALWSAAYYVHDELITHGKPVGDAFFDGMYTYGSRHQLRRGVQDLYLMGDPSLITEGIGVLDPEGSDVLVHGDRWSHFAASYDGNGDLYTVISAGASAQPAEFFVYRSTDHGLSWDLWHHVEGLPAIISLDAIVNHGGTDEFPYDDLLVFTTSLDGTLRVHTFALAGGIPSSATITTVDHLFNVVSVAHDNLDRGSRLYLGYCFYDSDATPHAVVEVSHDNGRNWPHQERFPGYYAPVLDGGPRDHVHLAAIRNNHTFDVCVTTSTDGGRSWGGWTNLTEHDGANDHWVFHPPSVAASTDPATPVIWVGHERRYGGLVGSRRTELGFSYSGDGGSTWQRNLTMAAGPGDTKRVQLAAYKPHPNPWVNGLYVSAQPTAISSTNAKLMHRAVSGHQQRPWRQAVIFNRAEAIDHRPQLVYSPGAPGTGGGAVFAATDGVYFSAPWLAT